MPTVFPEVNETECQEIFARAESELARGSKSVAADILERIKDCDPNNDHASLVAAMIRFEEGDCTRAASLALEALELRPFNPSAMNLLGVACMDAGHPDVARKILHRVTRIAPGFRKAKENLQQASGATAGGVTQSIPRKAIRDLLRPRKPRLSVCVIVREGSKYLANCLASCDGLASEFVVLDATVDGQVAQILNERPISVQRCAWDDDNSALRNAALYRARGDWVLVLESEERLQPGSGPRIARALGERTSLYQVVEIRHEPTGVRTKDLRLFRNAPGIRYIGRTDPRVHPCLQQLTNKWKLGEGKSNVVLERDSVPRYAAHWPEDSDRLGRLVDDDLRHDPENPQLKMQRARVDVRAGAVQEALADLDRVRAVLPADDEPRQDIDLEELTTLEARCLMRLGRFKELETRITGYHETHRPTLNTLFLLGVAVRANGRAGEAAEVLRRCFDASKPPGFLPPFAEILDSGLPNMLGAALLDLGRSEEARQAFDEALSRSPGNTEARIGILGTHLASGNVQELVRDLGELTRDCPEDPRVWSVGAYALGRVPALAATANEWMEEACRRFPEDVDFRKKLGQARLRCGQVDEAMQAWTGLPLQSAADVAARFAVCLCTGAELPAVLTSQQPVIEAEVLCWLQAWMASAAYQTLDRALLEIGRAAVQLPGLPDRTAQWLHEIGQAEAAERIHESLSPAT